MNNLNDKLNENENAIHQCEAKIHELKLGDFSERVGRISLMGTLFYLPTLAILFLVNTPGVILPVATLGCSYGLGALTNAHLERKAKCKSRFRKVSKSKNESERLEEVLRLEMEIERLKAHSDVITKVRERLSKEDLMYSKLNKSKIFEIVRKREQMTEKELIDKISHLESELEKKLAELDSLVDEDTIRNKKSVGNDKLNMIFHSMIYSMVPLLLTFLTTFTYMIRPLTSFALVPAFSALGIGVCTFVGSMIYFNKKKNDQNKAIARINKDRKEDKRINLDFLISSLKANINNIYFSLQDYKKQLEIISKSKETVVSEPNMNFILDETEDFDLENGPKLSLK